MRIRTVKPEFFTHEGLFEAEKETGLPIRIAFVGLWCVADREGRFRWQPRRLSVQIMPYDQVDFSRVLHACLTRGFVVAYRVNGEVFGVIPSFTKHQIINNREAESILPAPDSENAELLTKPEEVDACPTRAPRVPHATLTYLSGREGKGREGKGTEGESASPWLVKFGLELPESLRTQPCLDAVNLWLTHKAEIRDPYKATGLRMAMAKWANEFTPAEFPGMVEESVARGWKGIFRTKEQGQPNPKPQPAKPHPHQKLADELRAKLENHPADIQRVLDTGRQPTQDESREYSQLRDHLAALLMDNGGGK